ncbi:MAG: S1/P1 nuclease [Bacteroidetes bacterium]|nr:S1/P1 nuclease [Cryomorphaceae bacterium]MBL6677623.1 S1/P1 nuclease [Flavobacteriaceae bacterium]MDA0885355.1 S1/P1 nuclease [Bacteroidota bacterium]MDA1225360.1 S1/P1 nuclease [Bacteroidota bacterium]
MRLLVFFIASLLSLTNWGSTGHRALAEVASFYLTENAKNKINEILDGETIVTVSMYADDIRSDNRYDKYYDWHFINMELDEDYEDAVPSEKGDVFIAINKCLDILESDSLTDSDKSFYLKLLIHFIGDLHQPMHIGRYEDRGGNRVYVKWFGRNSNLHRVWDSEMINGYNMSYSELAKNLPTPENLEIEFERDDLIDWVNETHSYTRKIYNDVSIDDNLGYEYQYQNFQIVRELILKGGMRLASVLNYLFD